MIIIIITAWQEEYQWNPQEPPRLQQYLPATCASASHFSAEEKSDRSGVDIPTGAAAGDLILSMLAQPHNAGGPTSEPVMLSEDVILVHFQVFVSWWFYHRCWVSNSE